MIVDTFRAVFADAELGLTPEQRKAAATVGRPASARHRGRRVVSALGRAADLLGAADELRYRCTLVSEAGESFRLEFHVVRVSMARPGAW